MKHKEEIKQGLDELILHFFKQIIQNILLDSLSFLFAFIYSSDVSGKVIPNNSPQKNTLHEAIRDFHKDDDVIYIKREKNLLTPSSYWM